MLDKLPEGGLSQGELQAVIIGLRHKMRIFLQKEGRNPFTGLKAKSQSGTSSVFVSVLRPLGSVTVLITSCRPSSDLVLKPDVRVPLSSSGLYIGKKSCGIKGPGISLFLSHKKTGYF